MVVAAAAGPVVEVGSPEVLLAAVAGEVADGVAELFVHGPAEGHDSGLAGFAGGGCDAGQTGQRGGGGEPAAGVTDLGEQAGGADGAGLGQGGEDLPVGVDGQVLGDLLGECLDLPGDCVEGGQVGVGDTGQDAAVFAGGAAGRGTDACVQHGRVGAAAVADAGQPGGQASGREPVEGVLGGEAGEECAADRRVDVAEQVHHGGQCGLKVRPELVGHRDPVGDQVFTGPAQLPQCDGRFTVDNERGEPAPIGAHGVGQYVGVESVVLVPGRSVTAPQRLDLRRWNYVDGAAGGEQRVDDRPVRALDAHRVHAMAVQQLDQPAQTDLGIPQRRSGHRLPVAVDDADRVVVLGPVHTRRVRSRRPGRVGHTHSCLSAALSVGKHLADPGHHCRLLIERRSPVQAAAHSPVADRGAPGRRASQNSCWTSKIERAGRWPDGHRCARTLNGSSDTRVDQ
jgi:hypothetical protein